MSDPKQSLAEMRKQLRELRKDMAKPVSRMKKADIASELEKIRGKREETPPVASTVGAKPKKMEAKIADVKVAKEQGFPTKPVEESKAKKDKGSAVAKAPLKSSKKELLMKMLSEMSDSE